MNAIELYERLFYVFAGMGALSLALSVFLFFRFDIPQTYAMLTGRARRKTIQEIENRNAQTGRLRQNPRAAGEGTQARAPRRREPGGQNERAGKRPQADAGRRARRPRPEMQPTPGDRPETEVLSAPAMQTVMLSKQTGVTEDLARTEMLKPVPDTSFYFQITENTISIHTDEII